MPCLKQCKVVSVLCDGRSHVNDCRLNKHQHCGRYYKKWGVDSSSQFECIENCAVAVLSDKPQDMDSSRGLFLFGITRIQPTILNPYPLVIPPQYNIFIKWLKGVGFFVNLQCRVLMSVDVMSQLSKHKMLSLSNVETMSVEKVRRHAMTTETGWLWATFHFANEN